METPVPRIYLFPWQTKTFCFDFQNEGAMQGPTPAVLSAPMVTLVPPVGGTGLPTVGAPEVVEEDFWNAKGEVPRKVPAQKGVAVRIGPNPGETLVPDTYTVRCDVLADGTEPLTQAAILVVSETPEA